jgi:hypothetical protein
VPSPAVVLFIGLFDIIREGCHSDHIVLQDWFAVDVAMAQQTEVSAKKQTAVFREQGDFVRILTGFCYECRVRFVHRISFPKKFTRSACDALRVCLNYN